MSADKVPDGAVTVPLGNPKGGDQPATDDAGVPGGEPAESAATPVSGDSGTDTVATDELRVSLSEMFFDSDQIRIPADTDIKVTLENSGVTPHNFTVNDTDISVDVEPGASAEVVINLPAGKYRVICNVPGHKEAGMTAQLIVR